MELIECKDLSFSYEGRIVLQNVNFKVNQGDYVCIIGENGSGKSTLVKGILKLKNPVSGEIIYNNISSSEIGYLPQQTDMQKDFPASVFEVVLSGRLNSLKNRFFYNKEDKKIAIENMKLLGISDLKKRNYQELSGGQQQRVLLARALCSAKKVILMDEPVSGLDPQAVSELYMLISKLNKEHNMTVVMVSHDIDAALKYSTHILHLEHQQIFFGTTEDYKDKN